MRKTHKKRRAAAFAAAVVLAAASMSTTALAWNTDLYLYEPTLDESGQPIGWNWMDMDGNGIYECYYNDWEFYKTCGEEFWRALHFWNMTNVNNNICTVPDGYQVNAARQWIVDGVVQTRTKEQAGIAEEKPAINTSIAYDPAHPLARVIDAWNLQLVDTDWEAGTVGTTKFAGGSWNVQALLTGRTDQYNDLAADVPLVDGYYRWSDHGSDYCISEEEYLETKQHQQEIYQWFCNWLNGMDFENMSQMEKAQAIADVLLNTSYDTEYANMDKQNVKSRDPVYAVLIGKKGICWEYAMTAMAMAKAVGLKSTVFGSGNHACYFIQVDGLPYRGDNGLLQLGYSYYEYERTADWISTVSFID